MIKYSDKRLPKPRGIQKGVMHNEHLINKKVEKFKGAKKVVVKGVQEAEEASSWCKVVVIGTI